MPDGMLADSGIKFWIIEVSYGYGCIDYYGAFAKEDPIENELLSEDFYIEAQNNLWDQYSWTVTGWDDENIEAETEEEREELIAQAYEDFMQDVVFDARLAEAGENPEDYPIVYDERK